MILELSKLIKKKKAPVKKDKFRFVEFSRSSITGQRIYKKKHVPTRSNKISAKKKTDVEVQEAFDEGLFLFL